MELELLNTIGSLGGPIAVASVVWLYFKIKGFETRLDEGDKRMAEHERNYSALKENISKMGTDISFIRGLLEGRGGMKND